MQDVQIDNNNVQPSDVPLVDEPSMIIVFISQTIPRSMYSLSLLGSIVANKFNTAQAGF